MFNRWIFSASVLAFSIFALSACGGGGSGGGATPAATTSPTTTTTASSSPKFCCSDFGPTSMGAASPTGILAGPIAAPPAASFGTAPKQTAAQGGATFDGSIGGYPANVTFPMISTSLQNASPGLSAGPANTAATLTLVSTSANSSNFQLVIPALNLNFNFVNRENIVSNMDGITWGLSYVAAGAWTDTADGIRPLQSTAAFLFGYETPSSAMPSTGSGTYSGVANGSVYKTVGSNILTTQVSGSAAVSVNFTSGQVTGALTQMKQWDGLSSNGPQTYLPWNDVSLTANLAAGTNRFSGTTAASSAPGTAFSLAGSATGRVDGAFFGPAAQNVGAVWSLSDGAASVIGGLTAK